MPRDALGLELLQASALSLTDAELEGLDQRGFVILERQPFPSFVYGYQTVYASDLPVFVSADSILNAVHRSYDGMLMRLEEAALVPLVGRMLSAMRTDLASSSLPEATRRDLDVYLTVAHQLLDATASGPALPANQAVVTSLVQAATGAPQRWESLELFGTDRNVDFSQFQPRGHYAGRPVLESYFRSMMWIGRIDFRLIETLADGSQVFRRRQFDDAMAVQSLLTGAALTDWKAIDATLTGFVGEPDAMTPAEVAPLLQALGVADVAGLAAKSDAEIAQEIAAGGYGEQRILSDVVMKDPSVAAETLPLSATFLLLGQRFVVDSQVTSNVVFDRVQSDPRRMLPNPLDVAYAALANDQAAELLTTELDTYGYAPQLEATRILIDARPAEYWGQNLYNSWLGALRALSPAADNAGLPTVATTEPWGRRLLNTQLASWAELRHDTVLYVKQSYTSDVSCEYPDAYVDPYPETFAAIGTFAARGGSLVADLAPRLASMTGAATALTEAATYFDVLASVAARLEAMALAQRTGAPHSAEDIAFINETVSVQEMCGGARAEGWYSKLFFYASPTEFAPTIVDVHTALADGGGVNVLHVGTGSPALMVLTVPTCSGPRLYAGPVSTYFETVRLQRLTDDVWESELLTQSPRDVAWMSELVVPAP